MLSVDDAEWLRATAVAEFARAGAPDPRAVDDYLVDATGAVYGLGNLAAMLGATPKRQRTDAVREHARIIVTAQHRTEPTTIDDVAHLVVARVMSSEVPGDGPDLAPGLVVRACIDYPESVSTLGSLEAFGGWAAVEPLALSNLRRLPVPTHKQSVAPGGGVVHMLWSDDLFGASRLLLLDELLSRLLQLERPAHGVLVAVPHRHLLVLHVVEDASVVTAMQSMVRVALAGLDAPGPVSPFVYYRDPAGILQQVSQIGEDGSVQISVTGAFADAMNGLGLTS